MADSVEKFFGGLAGRGHEPALAHASGTIRFEIVDGKSMDRVLVSVHRGDVTVSRRNDAADCVVRMDRPLAERILNGQQNATAALLRGAVEVEGEVGLLVLFQKLLPAPSKRRSGAAKAKKPKR